MTQSKWHCGMCDEIWEAIEAKACPICGTDEIEPLEIAKRDGRVGPGPHGVFTMDDYWDASKL